MHRFLLMLALLAPLSGHAEDHVALLGTYTGGESRGIYVVRLDGDTGALSEPQLAAEARNPAFLALHPNGKVVYALNEGASAPGRAGGEVAAFAMEAATGALTPLGTEAGGGGAFAHLGVSPDGRLLVAASYGGGCTAAFPLAADGTLRTRTSLIQHAGPLGPNTARQEKPHAHSVTFSPDGRLAFVADLGLDRILAFRVDGEAGTLAPHEPAFAATAPGAGPRHAKFSADGKFFYVLDELDCTVTVFRYDAARGALEAVQRIGTLPADFAGKNTCSEIRVHPNGRFVFAANRGHDSIAVFARAAADGKLALVEIVPTGGRVPRNFALTPDGKWLLSAHQESNDLAVFRVDEATGRLTATGHTAKAAKPVCVLFLN